MESEGPCLVILSPHHVSDMELIGKHQTQCDFASGLLADNLKWLIADLLAARIFIGIFMRLDCKDQNSVQCALTEKYLRSNQALCRYIAMQ